MSETLSPQGARSQALDPRGPRFAAGITSVVLALVLVLHSTPLAVPLLALQTVVFAIGTLSGPAHTPYAWLFRRLVRPRLGPPADLEDPRPVRFAQGVGLGFAIVGLVGLLLAPVVGLVAIGAAFVAAFLNAAFGYCLGCEMYLLLRRAVPARGAS